MSDDTLPFPTEDNLPLSEEPQSGEIDHDLDDDRDDSWSNIQEEPPHPANPATVPLPEPEMITVTLTTAERLNMAVRMTGLMEEHKDAGDEVLKLNRTRKNLTKEIQALATCIRTNSKEVPANSPAQQNLLDVVPTPAEAAAQFAAMGQQAAKLAEEVPELTEEEKAERKRIDGLNAHAEAQQAAQGVPAASEGFQESSTDELSAQAGRKRGRKAA